MSDSDIEEGEVREEGEVVGGDEPEAKPEKERDRDSRDKDRRRKDRDDDRRRSHDKSSRSERDRDSARGDSKRPQKQEKPDRKQKDRRGERRSGGNGHRRRSQSPPPRKRDDRGRDGKGRRSEPSPPPRDRRDDRRGDGGGRHDHRRGDGVGRQSSHEARANHHRRGNASPPSRRGSHIRRQDSSDSDSDHDSYGVKRGSGTKKSSGRLSLDAYEKEKQRLIREMEREERLAEREERLAERDGHDTAHGDAGKSGGSSSSSSSKYDHGSNSSKNYNGGSSGGSSSSSGGSSSSSSKNNNGSSSKTNNGSGSGSSSSNGSEDRRGSDDDGDRKAKEKKPSWAKALAESEGESSKKKRKRKEREKEKEKEKRKGKDKKKKKEKEKEKDEEPKLSEWEKKKVALARGLKYGSDEDDDGNGSGGRRHDRRDRGRSGDGGRSRWHDRGSDDERSDDDDRRHGRRRDGYDAHDRRGRGAGGDFDDDDDDDAYGRRSDYKRRRSEHEGRSHSSERHAGGNINSSSSSRKRRRKYDEPPSPRGHHDAQESPDHISSPAPGRIPPPSPANYHYAPLQTVELLRGCRSVESYEWLNKIDEGTFGVVSRAKDVVTGEVVALKHIKMENERNGFPLTALREVKTLMDARGQENVVDIKEVCVGRNEKIYIVMEFAEHDLKGLMEEMKTPFLSSEVKCLIVQLLKGVDHMHQHWVLHRDLKTSNLLINNCGILKIADFGLAREYGDPLEPYTPTVVTLWYRAPELMLGTEQYSTAVDMWSVGCIFGELLGMEPMCAGKTELDQLNKIFQLLGTPNVKDWPGYEDLPNAKKVRFKRQPHNNLRKRFPLLSETGLDLLQRMLNYNPDERITAREALDHAWFKENPLPKNPDMMPTHPSRFEGKVRLTGGGGGGAPAGAGGLLGDQGPRMRADPMDFKWGQSSTFQLKI